MLRGVVVVAALALFAAPNALALTKPQADAAALKALAPAAGKTIVVFGLPQPLAANATVGDAAPARYAKNAKLPKPTRVGKKAWLYWEDLSYGAYFSHKSTLLLIDDRTGAVARRTTLSWWPLVNGSAPAFATKGYVPQTGAIYSGVKPKSLLAWRPQATFAPPLQLPPGAFSGDCILLVASTDSMIFTNDLNAVIGEGRRLGIPVYIAHHGSRQTDPPNAADMGNAVAALARNEHCKDILIYFHAHSYAPPSPAAMHMAPGRDITPDDVKKMVRKNSKISFKLIFDTCYAQRFGNALDSESNIWTTLASSSTTEESWWYHDHATDQNGNTVTNQTNNPGVTDRSKGLSEFLNGMLGGIESVATDADAVRQVQDNGGSFLAGLLVAAWKRESDNDFASKTGNTHPYESYNPNVLPRQPTVTPIGAVFIQADFATDYGVQATDPDNRKLTYKWTLTPPDKDPNCSKFAQVAAEPWRAIWQHGDQHGCNHTVTDPQGRGHPGTVTVVVSNGFFDCTATYFGTETGTGPAPTCKPK